MSSSIILSDNGGFGAPPGIAGYTPKAASGITLTDSATGGDHTQALTAGKTYVAMADSTAGGQWLLGIAAVTTAANALWLIPVGGVLSFHLPVGSSTLPYECLASGGSLYIVELEE